MDCFSPLPHTEIHFTKFFFQAKFLWHKAAQSTLDQLDAEEGFAKKLEVNAFFVLSLIIFSFVWIVDKQKILDCRAQIFIEKNVVVAHRGKMNKKTIESKH
jgi:hypothetical protein